MNTTASGVRPRNRGFTLVELLMVMTVLGVMMVFAVPNFREYQRNAALTSTANTLVSSVYRTRSEAMKEGVPVAMVPGNASGPSGTDWTQGWVIYADRNLDGAYTEAGDKFVGKDDEGHDVTFSGILDVQAGDDIPSDYLAITVNCDNTVRFAGNGFPKPTSSCTGNLTITVTRTDKGTPVPDRYIRRIIVSTSGRVKSCRPDVDGTANCPAPPPASGGGGGGSGGGGSGG